MTLRPHTFAILAAGLIPLGASPSGAEPEVPRIKDVPVSRILAKLGARMEKGADQKTRENYTRHFARLDLDGDGRHSKTEFIEKGTYLNPQARRGIFNAADRDRDGFVTKDEYILNRIITDEAKRLLNAMDDNRDGVIQQAEFVTHADAKLPDGLAPAVFEALDTNQNGGLVVPEYLRVWGQWARAGRGSADQRLAPEKEAPTEPDSPPATQSAK